MASDNKNQTFEDLQVWQEAKELTKIVYDSFSDSNDFEFKNQIEKAAISVMNNIAEGFERESQDELKRFLYIAKGSCGEVRSMVILVKELDYISKDRVSEIQDQSVKISKMLSQFIKKL